MIHEIGKHFKQDSANGFFYFRWLNTKTSRSLHAPYARQRFYEESISFEEVAHFAHPISTILRQEYQEE